MNSVSGPAYLIVGRGRWGARMHAMLVAEGRRVEFAAGLRKGLGVGAWAIACSLPAWFLRSDGLVTAIAIVVAAALFYGVLGVLTQSQSARYSDRVLKRGVSNTS